MRGVICTIFGEFTLDSPATSPPQHRRWLALILALQFVVGLAVITTLPLWQGHEADYYAVVRFLTENGRLPTEADYPPGEADVRQATQPPLFFLAAAPVVALLDDGQSVPPGSLPGLICIGGESANGAGIDYPLTPDYLFPPGGAVLAGYALRVLNLCFGLIAVAFTYLTGRVLFPRQPAIALIGAALLAFEPNTLSMVVIISNDAPLLAIAAAHLYAAARMLEGGIVRWRWLTPLMATAALAILTRLSGWAVFGFAVLVVLYAIGRTLWQAQKHAKPAQARLALGGLALLIIAIVAVGAFNYSQYGTVFGRYRWLDEFVLSALQNFNLPYATVVGVFEQTRNDYLTPLNPLTGRPTIRTLYTLPVLLGLVGALVGLIAAAVRRLRGQPAAPSLGSYLLLFGAVAAAVALVLFRNTINVSAMGGATLYNTAAIFAPLRYYNAGLPPLALLLSAGLVALVEPVRSVAGARLAAPLRRLLAFNPIGLGLAVLWLVVAALGALLLARERSTAQVVDLRSYLAAMEQPASSTTGSIDIPTLYRYSLNPRPEAGFVSLQVDAGVTSPTMLIYAVEVDMTAEGEVINRCQFLPGRGFHPTTIWQSESVVSFAAEIPNCAGPINAPIDLSLRWLGADLNGQIQNISPPVSLGTLDAPLAQAEPCPGMLGTIAEGYRLTRFNSPPSVKIGETYLPSVNWIITAPSPDVAGRAYVFSHVESGEQYTCAGMDQSPQTWTLGEYVFFDRCSMVFPPEATPGTYTVSVALYNAEGQSLPATDAEGNLLPGNAVQVGTVQLEQ